MDEAYSFSTRLWAGLLIVSTVSTPLVLSGLKTAGSLEMLTSDRRYQSLAFLGACFVGMAFMAFRILIGRAIERGDEAQAGLLTGIGLAALIGLLTYGVTAVV